MAEDETVSRLTARYPAPELTYKEFADRATEISIPTREQAAEPYGMLMFVGHCYTASSGGGLEITTMSTEYPEDVAELLLGVVPNSPDRG